MVRRYTRKTTLHAFGLAQPPGPRARILEVLAERGPMSEADLFETCYPAHAKKHRGSSREILCRWFPAALWDLYKRGAVGVDGETVRPMETP